MTMPQTQALQPKFERSDLGRVQVGLAAQFFIDHRLDHLKVIGSVG